MNRLSNLINASPKMKIVATDEAIARNKSHSMRPTFLGQVLRRSNIDAPQVNRVSIPGRPLSL
jgi:hypothetical protein